MDVKQLQNSVTGSVLVPGDSAYESSRLPWNRLYDPHPALILVAKTPQDVAAGVQFARAQGLGVAVQTTGHGIQRLSDENLLIVMSEMAAVKLDAEARTARAEGGAIWQHVLDQALPHSLAPLLGSSPHVGVVGYTLGGGIGWLARHYGLAADSVRSIDLVTADGVLRRASATENADLFWAMRGAGGNFGVVTALEFDLYPVAALYGGFLVYPGELAREALRFYRDWALTAPDELTSSFAIINFPSLPFLPEALRGKTQIFVRAAYSGNPAEGARYIQPWLDWNTPLENTFRVMPFSEVATINNDPVNPTAGYGSNEMFDTLSDAAIDIIARRATDKASPLVVSELRHAGGAIARPPADASAISNREAQFYFQLGGPLFPPNTKETIAAAFREYKAELQPYLRGGVYLNFMAAGEAADRAKDAFSPDSYQRLLALKSKYDPDNMFRFAYPLGVPETEQA